MELGGQNGEKEQTSFAAMHEPKARIVTLRF
jgi:hypothetical protein